MKVKIIELLNMISKGEAPKKIKFDDIIFEYDEDDKLYYSDNLILEEYCNITQYLNDEIEIIEEDKKIEKLDLILDEHFSNDELQAYIKETQEKVNEIIDKINED